MLKCKHIDQDGDAICKPAYPLRLLLSFFIASNVMNKLRSHTAAVECCWVADHWPSSTTPLLFSLKNNNNLCLFINRVLIFFSSSFRLSQILAKTTNR